MDLKDIRDRFYESNTPLEYFKDTHGKYINSVGFDVFLADLVAIKGLVPTLRFLRGVWNLSLGEAREIIRQNNILEDSLEAHRRLIAVRDIADDVLHYCKRKGEENNSDEPTIQFHDIVDEIGDDNVPF